MNAPERQKTAREIIDEIRRKGDTGTGTEGPEDFARVTFREMADYAERLEDAITRETANESKMREALERLLRFLQWMYAQEGRSADVGRDRLSDEIDVAVSALAAPPRNCDRFHSPRAVKEAVEAWLLEYVPGHGHPLPVFSLAAWLLAIVNRGVECPKCADGLRGIPDCNGCHADCVAVRNAENGGKP